ncbi:CD3072 family TudS-related putative desulfidase [Clostridium sp. UBA4548]|uniref:CD3072 family TudS-related putative desulfidase n=1 Tax=Clostridium sp. UBA4548 TaxID=1946361 RepID=UPI0025BA8844|nr:CD3072 family TudS-related putative desulfidase [Clostridium sp. UBA4548]
MNRGKNLVLVSHCLLNQNSVVPPLARAKGAFPIAKGLIEEGIGILQLPCPEFKFLGPERKPMSKEEYDSKEYRELCKNLFKPVLEDIKIYLKSGYNLLGILGINESPTCSITKERGIFMEEILEALEKENIKINYFEIPTTYTEGEDYNELYSSLRKELGV